MKCISRSIISNNDPRSCIVLLWFACLTPAQTPKCVEVEGDRILARDFAVSLPGFGRLSPETALAPAPMPGVRRFFHPSELAALARRYSVDIDQDAALCFERQTEMLDRDRVLEAMRLALPLPGLEIEIVETSLYPVPRGRLEFAARVSELRHRPRRTPRSSGAATSSTATTNVLGFGRGC